MMDAAGIFFPSMYVSVFIQT